ncbi:MAG: class A beta-lactamase-related serine hydrolase [Planctomycetaceae bacterium]|nr:serine hydrolase [Phycisphaerales bacterium]MCE2653027.1 class A beta-lactamase-related serine hydrolase [Planctomycetaceae bacterium]
MTRPHSPDSPTAPSAGPADQSGVLRRALADPDSLPDHPPAEPPPLPDSPLLGQLLQAATGPLAEAMRTPHAFRLQILLGLVVPGPGGRPVLQQHGFRVDAEYIYPASTVKLCAAAGALLFLRHLAAATGRPITRRTPLRFHPCFPDQSVIDHDPDNLDGQTITVESDIRKIALVSDNPAHNRLYTLLGHRRINHLMWGLGLPSVRINHRLSEFRPRDEQRRTGAVDLLIPDGSAPLTLPQQHSDLLLDNAGVPRTGIGTAHVPPGGTLADRIDQPLDCSWRNRFGLADMQRLLALLVRPDLVPDNPIAADLLPTDDRKALLAAMTQFPGDSPSPVYSRDRWPDHCCKFFLPGLRRVLPADRVRVINKVGRAYGFSIENAYCFDTVTGRPFFLAAALEANPAGLVGFDGYADAAFADPLLADLGELVARKVWA